MNLKHNISFEDSRKELVLIKDRDKNVEMLRIAINLVGLHISYHQADLINEVLKKKRSKSFATMNLEDAVEIRDKWEKKWLEYHKEDDIES